MAGNARIPPPRSDSKPIFATIEDELRDARRVGSHGQEEDLKQALSMVMKRVSELSTMLKEAYKTQTELETSLNVAKSNLQLVMANNEMLEEALRREPGGGNNKDVGWRRSRGSIAEEQRRSIDGASTSGDSDRSPVSPIPSYVIPPTPPPSDGRFFRFRFNKPATTPTSSGRSTPTLSMAGSSNLASASLPSLAPLSPSDRDQSLSPSVASPGGATKELSQLQAQIAQERVAFERERRGMEARAREADTELKERARRLEIQRNEMLASEREAFRRVEELESEKEMERRGKEMEKQERERVCQEKEALEGEIESLSQALFEEANKMVASERIRRHETEEELREANSEKEALRSALRLIEGHKMATMTTRSRSSSETGLKSASSSRAGSPTLSIRAPSSSSGNSMRERPMSPTLSVRAPSPTLSVASFSLAARQSMDSSRSPPSQSLGPPRHNVSVPTSPGDAPFSTPTTEANTSISSFFPRTTNTSPPPPLPQPDTPTSSPAVDGASPWADVPSSPAPHSTYLHEHFRG